MPFVALLLVPFVAVWLVGLETCLWMSLATVGLCIGLFGLVVMAGQKVGTKDFKVWSKEKP